MKRVARRARSQRGAASPELDLQAQRLDESSLVHARAGNRYVCRAIVHEHVVTHLNESLGENHAHPCLEARHIHLRYWILLDLVWFLRGERGNLRDVQNLFWIGGIEHAPTH